MPFILKIRTDTELFLRINAVKNLLELSALRKRHKNISNYYAYFVSKSVIFNKKSGGSNPLGLEAK
jgi:hypothetical protein